MPEYPIQLGKVQAPPLRDETLERTRLLEWLNVKIHRRVVLVTAEAGYGKTTLLADFSRRSRVRTFWYRLDRGDRDWLGFIAYLVAAIRAHLPEFGPVTRSLVRESGDTSPPRDTVLDTFIRELGDLPPEPTALVLDDLHVVDDSIDVRTILRELLVRAPERLAFVLISRRTPPAPLARLRALGEVAELGTADLRFDSAETEQLFRETYSMSLEPAVVAELSRRTEGWAASLQLVRTAIRDRSPSEIRAFVTSLSGAEGHLYDYLAEEVVGELDPELQQFLMRTSLLETVEPVLGAVASGITAEQTRTAIAEGEKLGLFSRIGTQSRDQVRAHPLVRDFLQARLLRSVGAPKVAAIHRKVAAAAEPIDWRTAGHHYVAAGDLADARRILAGAIESILATGAYAAAEELARALPEDATDAALQIVASRMALKRGDTALALSSARAAAGADGNSEISVWNLLMISISCSALGDIDEMGKRLQGLNASPLRRLSAEAVLAGIRSSVHGDLAVAFRLTADAARVSRREGKTHFLGVALTNLAQIQRARGDAAGALESASEAIAVLETTSAGVELDSARLVAAWAQAHRGVMDEARSLYELALANSVRPLEATFEAADIEVLYGDLGTARSLLAAVDATIDPSHDVGEQALLTRIAIDIRAGDLDDARTRVGQLSFGRPATGVAIEARRWVAASELALTAGESSRSETVRRARDTAGRQEAWLWARHLDCLIALDDQRETHVQLPTFVTKEPVYLSMAAEWVCHAMARLTPPGLAAVADEARSRPNRWRPPLRGAISRGPVLRQLRAAELLDEIGTAEDIPDLRAIGRRARFGRSGLGRNLARRLAKPVWVEDLGRVRLEIGERRIEGGQVRRRVLELLCLLLTKPRMAASREEVVDALWPESDPGPALNSLNQTVYFLRRLFEPDFDEDLTPGYVEQNSETLWLDQELVRSRSELCRSLIREVRGDPTPEQAIQIARAYRGRFALDFLYDDWSAAYRDTLHASYLRVIEASLRLDIESGHYLRGIEVAQLASEVEADSEEIQLALLRLYRLSGSHAAAAEQYGHYAHGLRELGIEPQPFSSL